MNMNALLTGQIENFSNFILGEHSGNRFNVIIEHYKVNTFTAIP